MTIAFIAYQFRFSDYYHVCKDIENYAISQYNSREAAKIKDKLESILEALHQKFYRLHSKCHDKHPSTHIKQEILLMRLLAGDLSALEEKMLIKVGSSHLIDKKKDLMKYEDLTREALLVMELESNGFQTGMISSLPEIEYSVKINTTPFSAHSEVLLEQGAILNDLLLYKGAIDVLTKSLKYDSSNINVYIERAMAYFETDQISLALKDYQTVLELKNKSILKSDKMAASISSKIEMHRMLLYIPEQKGEFIRGLISGIVNGASISGEEFIPSIFDCCRGILCGLWAFAISPRDVSQEMVNATYAIGEYIAYHSPKECLECVVPELRELSVEWEKINDHSRGKKIGYIIGKYGLDVFAPLVAFKGISKLRAIKRANTMSTLQGCAISHVKKKKILEESAKRSILRKVVISDAIDNGKILIKNSNSQIHIMQPKHKWNILIKVTGNVEVDCKNVIKLLEENRIFLKEYNIKKTNRTGFIIFRQEMKINDYVVTAEFSKNLESGEMFLNNAWVGH